MDRRVVIDCFAGETTDHWREYAVVAVDVIRATTTAITAVSSGRRCYPVPSLEAAFDLAGRLRNPLLAGELGGVMPPGFHLNNSPADLAVHNDRDRPLVLLSSSGTQLLWANRGADAVYLASFRNAQATASQLAGRHGRVALIGAGSRGEFREEDQMCCAWMARDLLALGYSPADPRTAGLINRWKMAPPSACLGGNSAAYLRRSGQVRDLDFILAHVNDLDEIYQMQAGEVVLVTRTGDARTFVAAGRP